MQIFASSYSDAKLLGIHCSFTNLFPLSLNLFFLVFTHKFPFLSFAFDIFGTPRLLHLLSSSSLFSAIFLLIFPCDFTVLRLHSQCFALLCYVSVLLSLSGWKYQETMIMSVKLQKMPGNGNQMWKTLHKTATKQAGKI